MIYLKKFEEHSQYEAFTGTTDFVLPNVSYCETQNEVHYNPLIIKEYKSLVFLTDEENATLQITMNYEESWHPVTFQYSLDEEKTWEEIEFSDSMGMYEIPFGKGTPVYLRGDNYSGVARSSDAYSVSLHFDVLDAEGAEQKEYYCEGDLIYLLVSDGNTDNISFEMSASFYSFF